MSVESAADRAAMLADFGENVVWTVSSTPSTIRVLFDSGTVRNELDFDGGVLNARGTLVMRAADIPAGGAKGNGIVVRSAALLIKSIELDGTGMALVRVGDAR